jgi:hypothetical protein
MSKEIDEVKKRVVAARSTLDNTDATNAIPYVVSALESIVAALEKLETEKIEKFGCQSERDRLLHVQGFSWLC